MATGYMRGDFMADAIDEHVLIQARVGSKGQIICADGSPLPALREGASVQLRVRSVHLTAPEERASLRMREVKELLPAGAWLLAIIDTRALGDQTSWERLRGTGLTEVLARASSALTALTKRGEVRYAREHVDKPQAHEGVMRVELLAPLVMERRGQKSFRLQPCPCRVPDLPGPADGIDFSLNHALTRLSELLEVHRISHTGNVFTRYLAPVPGADVGVMARLGVLRDLC